MGRSGVDRAASSDTTALEDKNGLTVFPLNQSFIVIGSCTLDNVRVNNKQVKPGFTNYLPRVLANKIIF